MKKYLIPTIIIAAIVAIILLNLKGSGGKKVKIEKVKLGTISKTVNGSGSLRAKSQIDISSQVIGQVERIYVKEGDYVHKGDILLKLDDVSYRADYNQARASFQDARKNYQRAKKLHNEELIADEELEKAKLSLEIAQAQYNRSKDQLEKTVIKAPISGRVLLINVESGETVLVGTMNNPGTVLLTIADLSRMIAEIEVGETEIPVVKNGQEALVRIDAMPDTSFPGKVVKVGYMPIQTLTSIERTTDFEVEVELKNPGSLKPGMSAEADIMTVTKDTALVVPIQAISRKREKARLVSFVFLHREEKAVKKEVATGISSDQEIEITEGLKEGDEIITGPYHILSKLKGGEKIVVEESGEKAATNTDKRPLRRKGRLKPP